MIKINSSDIKKAAPYLKAGDRILLNGYVYWVPLNAHTVLMSLIRSGKTTPFSIDTAVLCFSEPGIVNKEAEEYRDEIGRDLSELYDRGMHAMIGQNAPGDTVKRSLIRNGTLYLTMPADGSFREHIGEETEIFFDADASVSVHRYSVDSLCLLVGMDSYGHSVFDGGTI